MSFVLFLSLFVEFKKNDRRVVVERKKSTISRLPLDVCSPSFGAPRERSYENCLLQNKVRGDDFLSKKVWDEFCRGEEDERELSEMGEVGVVLFGGGEGVTKGFARGRHENFRRSEGFRREYVIEMEKNDGHV
nr:hypothetical protein [Tanacetum cinerariifolium]